MGVRLLASLSEFDQFLEAAETFWRTNALPSSDEQWIITEALHQDIRVTLRNLTVANALRRIMPARVLVVTGTDDDWFGALFQAFNTNHTRRMCEAFGAEMLDIHQVVDQRLAATDGVIPPLVIGGRELPLPPEGVGIDAVSLAACVDATACRIKLVPRLADGFQTDPDFQRTARRTEVFSQVYDQLMNGLGAVALITSHVDYNQWGTAVDAAVRAEVPVVHTQSTGSLKAYALFPESRRGLPGIRADLTTQIGRVFEDHVWANRDVLRRSAELVAWRSKANLGRPSWWRAGATASADLTNDVEREQIRAHALNRFGFDPSLPVISVFDHAVSDALGTNHEAFDDLAEWFEETVVWASGCPKASWLFIDHPSQALYDSTDFFAGLAERYADHSHMAFRPSAQVPKNVLWSVTDLGVTVRGSVSNELPAYGIPVVQAGWSEWSHCGLSLVADDPDAYFDLLSRSIDALGRGEAVITDEMVERARLWLWFYRSATDVVTDLVPTWAEGDRNPLLRSLRIFMRNVESDGDAAFSSVQRMWLRREPFLTRLDLTSRDALVTAVLPTPLEEGRFGA